MPFKATPRTTKIGGFKAGNEADIFPIQNIPSFLICKKLTQMANGVPTPCVPAPAAWTDTYEAKVGGAKALLQMSCMRCTTGQGKIEFITSGQAPLPPDVVADMQSAEKESKQALDKAQQEAEAVGEAGFVEGLIPIWGSGRDLIHAAQTGDGWGIGLNSLFLVWDAFSIVAGALSFGTATVAMMGAKAGVRTALKAAGKVVLSSAKKQGAELLAKSAKVFKGLGPKTLGFTQGLACKLLKACFPAGTPIATKEGYKNIEDIQVGDLVWSWDQRTGDIGLKPVIAIMENESNALIKITSGSETIHATPEHPFWVGESIHGVWKNAGELTESDELWLLDKRNKSIFSLDLEPQNKPVKVYNFEVADWHNYFVGVWMMLVHNNTVCVTQAIEKLHKYGRAYLNEIASITGRRVHPKQLKELANALRNKRFKKLSKSSTDIHREEFTQTVKDALILKWEKETGQVWPRYTEVVLSKKGKPYLKKGGPYDAHHIIENHYGGPHEWWNIHPARNPTEHQGGIHGKDAISKLLFN